MSNKKYIYNARQAMFYINHGAKVLDVNIHAKPHRTFWVFDYEETKEVYLLWLEECRKYKASKQLSE